MDESSTYILCGKSSILTTPLFPPFELSPNKNYVLGLVEFLSYNTIPNIDVGSNKFYAGGIEVTIPVGAYDIGDIEKFLQKELEPHGITLSLKPNNNTLRVVVKSNELIDFEREDSIGRLLGFTPKILIKDFEHESDLPVDILKVQAVRVNCNIIGGSYLNDQKVHTIHQFFPKVNPGFKIIEVPAQIIYLPITVKSIDLIELRIVDQEGNLINFQEADIIIRIHIKTL